VRITGGRLKNRSVPVVDRPDLRPTSARVREALFQRLCGCMDDARVLDAFGGSGILSLEAWSRGASEVVCLERDRAAARQIVQTVSSLGAVGVRVVQRDTQRWKGDPFDIILADPPYRDAPERWVNHLQHLLRPGGRLVLEHRTGALVTRRFPGLRLEWQRRYGDTELTFFHREEAPVTDEDSASSRR